MKNVMRKLAVGGLLALAAGAASAEVTVVFVEPARFSDLPIKPWHRQEVLKDLNDHFTRLGAELPPGQDLHIRVKDVDLVGILYPSRGLEEYRVVRHRGDWPRITLEYSLESSGQVLRSGEKQLRDMTFMRHVSRYTDGDSLRYEKRMIDDWFYSTILKQERTARR
jgi:hypothetical protein